MNMNDLNWVPRQIELNISRFDKAMEEHHPESRGYLHDPVAYYSRIVEQTNYLDAVRLLDWNKYLEKDCTVLDLGGGTGWLSAYMSNFEAVSRIYLVDSSRHFLLSMMPGIVKLMDGKAEKIVPIEGLFSPLLFEDKSLDAVVLSSALHHADNMEHLLIETRRVLKDEGVLMVLNETPVSYWRYFIFIMRQSLRIMSDTLCRQYKSVSASVSSSGFLYDPFLQDRYYPLWYWTAALGRAGFRLDGLIDTGMRTLKGSRKGINLKHFVCRKTAFAPNKDGG